MNLTTINNLEILSLKKIAKGENRIEQKNEYECNSDIVNKTSFQIIQKMTMNPESFI